MKSFEHLRDAIDVIIDKLDENIVLSGMEHHQNKNDNQSLSAVTRDNNINCCKSSEDMNQVINALSSSNIGGIGNSKLDKTLMATSNQCRRRNFGQETSHFNTSSS